MEITIALSAADAAYLATIIRSDSAKWHKLEESTKWRKLENGASMHAVATDYRTRLDAIATRIEKELTK